MSTDRNMQIRHFDQSQQQWDNLQPRTHIEQVNGLRSELDNIRAIAEGAKSARVFDDLDALNAWLNDDANRETLNIGDNFFLRSRGEPDFWWTGEGIAELESDAVNLVNASSDSAGLMSSDDFDKLASIAHGATANEGTVTSVSSGTANTITVTNGEVAPVISHVDSSTVRHVSDAEKTSWSNKADGVSVHVGLNAPANPQNGDIWFDFNN